MNDWIAVGALAALALALPVIMMVASALLRPTVPEKSKRETYESGEIPTGGTRTRFNIQYYMVALLFVVFDIEAVLLFPWAVVYSDAIAHPEISFLQAIGPMLLFVGILVVGLAWAWRKGAVQWARGPVPALTEVRER